MGDRNAGEESTEQNSSVQETDQVGTEKNLDQSEKTNASEGAKTQDAKADSSDEEGANEQNKSSDKDKPAPFHKHPRFKRLISRNKRLEETAQTQTEQIGELKNLVQELLALNKNEEYKPEPKESKNSMPNADELLDMEMEDFLDDNDLSESEEIAIIDIAKKYAKKLPNGHEVYLSPDVAFQIYKDQQNLNKETTTSKETVNTKPSSRVSETDTTKENQSRPKAKSIAEAVARAKRLGAIE